MKIPQVDYSPIYNALNMKSRATEAEYTMKTTALQKQAQQTNALVGLAELGLEAAKLVVDARAQREVEQAKDFFFKSEEALKQKAYIIIANDDYNILGGVQHYDPITGEPTGGGEEVVVLGQDYDIYFNDLMSQAETQFKSKEVKSWVKDQLRVAYQGSKNKALSYAYKKEEQDYVTLFTSNLNSAIKQSIASGDKGIYEAQISSSKFSSKQKQALRADAEIQFSYGMIKKDIVQQVKENGTESAIDYIQSLNKDAQTTSELISYAIDQGKVISAVNSKVIADVVTEAQKQNIKPAQIAQAIKGLSTVSDYYKKEAIDTLTLQQSMLDVRNALLKGGYAQAIDLADKLGRDETEKLALRQSADQADREMLNQVDSEIQTAYKKLSDAGIPQATILDTLEKAEYQAEYLTPAIDKVKTSMSIKANAATMEEYNRPGVRGNLSAIKTLYNKILKDDMGRYAGLETQKTIDLDYLEREINSFDVSAPSATELQKETDKEIELIFKGFTENAMIPGTNEHFTAEKAISMIRDRIPQASKNYATDVINDILKYEAPQHKILFDNMNDAIKTSMVQGYGKKKYDELPDESKKEIAMAQSYIYNWAHDTIGHEPTISAEKLQAGIDKQLAVYFAKEYDILRKGRVEQTGKTGPEGTLPDIVAGMTKGDYDELVYADTTSGQIIFNPKAKDTLEAAYEILEGKVQEITGSKPLRSYQIQQSGDVGAMPIFTDTNTGSQYTFGVDYTGKGLVTYTRENSSGNWHEWNKPYQPSFTDRVVPQEAYAGVKLQSGKTIPAYGTIKEPQKTTQPARETEVVKIGNELYAITTQFVNGKPVEISRRKIPQSETIDFSTYMNKGTK